MFAHQSSPASSATSGTLSLRARKVRRAEEYEVRRRREAFQSRLQMAYKPKERPAYGQVSRQERA